MLCLVNFDMIFISFFYVTEKNVEDHAAFIGKDNVSKLLYPLSLWAIGSMLITQLRISLFHFRFSLIDFYIDIGLYKSPHKFYPVIDAAISHHPQTSFNINSHTNIAFLIVEQQKI